MNIEGGRAEGGMGWNSPGGPRGSGVGAGAIRTSPFRPSLQHHFRRCDAFALFTVCATMHGPKAMNKPTIVAYLKPTCGWSQGVRAVLRKYDLPYEDRDIINDPAQREEMIRKSGQALSPCVEINGHMLADISGAEVETWLLDQAVVQPNDRPPDAPLNQACVH